MSRKFPRPIKRIVVKVGTSVIATFRMKPRTARLRDLVRQIVELRARGIEVVLVSSGAIVLGMGQFKEYKRPTDLASLQACAAIGQTVLMQSYIQLFKKFKSGCAQVLLTWDDFDDRGRYNNARNTLEAILERGITPVVNENDTISTDEIKFGDNDKLSALVASLIHADLLLLLSDVEGLYEIKDGQKKLFEEIKDVTKEIEGVAAGSGDQNRSKGGMITKLDAVKMATHSNIPCIIAHGETENVLSRILSGERIGTYFFEKEEKLLARKHWISFGAKPKGKLIVDDGAKRALLEGGRSLLLPGILRWDGHFRQDDVVIVADQNDLEIARGIINYSVTDLHRIEDKKGKEEVIHRDCLVFSKKDK